MSDSSNNVGSYLVAATRANLDADMETKRHEVYWKEKQKTLTVMRKAEVFLEKVEFQKEKPSVTDVRKARLDMHISAVEAFIVIGELKLEFLEEWANQTVPMKKEGAEESGQQRGGVFGDRYNDGFDEVGLMELMLKVLVDEDQ
ncbi:hypothetical protein H0H93_000795 [Arthromyces matolae]|nr:hypothetical protein H0H93_000795 [Arthromyces matolae]